MTFVPGQTYVRQELHDRFGGQRFGGISTPTDHPMIFLFTGKAGEQYGYEDGFQDNGTFWYTGEGQVGDMEMKAGNRAIRDHAEEDKTLHLFTSEGQPTGVVEYMGEATYLDHHWTIAPDKNGDPRRAIVFELEFLAETEGEPSPSIEKDVDEAPGDDWEASLEELRRRALASGRDGSGGRDSEGGGGRRTTTTTYRRSQAVHAYVLRRAEGTCEGCGDPAPFTKRSGRPYLEPHHIRRRADAGPDHPRWVIALCPNCHRRVHYGRGGKDYNEELADRAGALEGVDT